MAWTFQSRVADWMARCFPPRVVVDRAERNHRFLEEALEFVQSTGCTANEAHQLVDYVFGRPVGEPGQEVGGVMVTLAAACGSFDLDIVGEAERELERILDPVVMAKIQAKQAAKPKHSPLPIPVENVSLAAQLRGLINRANDQDLRDGGRYFGETFTDLTQCRHGDTGEYSDCHDGDLVEFLWNHRWLFLAHLSGSQDERRGQ